MKKLLFLLTLLPLVLTANEKLLILEEIQKEIINEYDLAPTEQTITVLEKTPSQGELKVQEMLEKNRAKIQKEQSTQKPLSGKEKIAQLLEKNRKKIKAQKKESTANRQDDWIKRRMKQQQNWRQDRSNQITAWEKKKKEILSKWYNERKKYLKRVPQYKKTLTEIPAPQIPPQKFKQITKKVPPLNDYHLIAGAFDTQAKDQGKRPTCAAFAGVRAIEIMLTQMKAYQPLSEQYFFWASLPNCQKRKCGERGSWVDYEYAQSQKAPSPDIPTADNCPYNGSPENGNVNQTPLTSNCKNGYAKIKSFTEVNSAQEIIEQLKQNKPVIAAFKLSENFYYNKGYVFLNSKLKFKVKLDNHAAGHAVLLVGYMKLPSELHNTEGKFCFITANSWGIGWGKGGHACLSEKWFYKHRYQIPFIALRSVEAAQF